MNLVLIGYRGTGKSSVAQVLADRLGCEWVDADDALERRAGMSISEIFGRHGEPWFRDLESEVLRDLCAAENTVIASGGGVVLRAENRELLAANSTVVWLKATAETLFSRVQDDPLTTDRRPNLTASGGYDEINDLLTQRTPLYRQAAQFEVDTDARNPAQIADEIVSLLGAT